MVTNVTDLSAQESFVPPILGRLAVFDARFRFHDSERAVDQIAYSIKFGGQWDSPGTPEWADHNQQVTYLLSLPNSKRFFLATRKRRLALTGIILVVAVALPVFLFTREMWTKKASKSG